MKFEWDEKKNQTNILKHKLDFRIAIRVFFDEYRIEMYDEEHSSNNEDRYKVIGKIGSKHIVTVVSTERNDRIRIISARAATKQEVSYYYEQDNI